MKYLSLLITAVLSLPASAAEKPNILWIYAEDLSPLLETYGDKINVGKTPAITKLSKSGVQFSRCFVPAPVCSPSRSALITGVYQTTTGFHQHRSSRTLESAIQIPEGIKTLPQLFAENGYATFNRGKDDYNFVYKRDEHYTLGSKKGESDVAKRKSGSGEWKNVPEGMPWFGQIQIRGGKSNMKSLKDKVDTSTVNLPPYYPNEEVFKQAWARNYNSVRVTDRDVKVLINDLEKDGLLENTIVFFFSDHGSNHSLRHKQFCYEGGVHVPLIISGPKVEKNKIRNEMVSGLDISATTLALAGIELPDYLDGQDLFSSDYKKRDHVISARDRCDYTIDRIRTVRTENFRYIKNFLTDRVLLQPQYRDNLKEMKRLRELHAKGKLSEIPEWAFFGKRPAEELYDLRKDPHQINNLAHDPAHAEELKEHRDLLNTWTSERGDKGAEPESQAQLRATYKLWGDKCVNPEYDFIKREKR